MVGLVDTVMISNRVFVISICLGATLIRRAGYTLGFAMHFCFLGIHTATMTVTLHRFVQTTRNAWQSIACGPPNIAVNSNMSETAEFNFTICSLPYHGDASQHKEFC